MQMTDHAIRMFIQPFNDLARSLNQDRTPKRLAVPAAYWDEFSAPVRFSTGSREGR
jgi:hypothetical protein